MQISIETILQKIADELSAAKRQSYDEQTVREHLAAVQALCGLVLDTKQESKPFEEIQAAAPRKLSSAPVRMKEQDEDGGSLLDF